MLFNEVYGSYYNVIAAILSEAVSGELTDKRIGEIIREKAFGESVLSIPVSLRDGSWPLLTRENATPLEHTPSMPLTTLQKRCCTTRASSCFHCLRQASTMPSRYMQRMRSVTSTVIPMVTRMMTLSISHTLEAFLPHCAKIASCVFGLLAIAVRGTRGSAYRISWSIPLKTISSASKRPHRETR